MFGGTNAGKSPEAEKETQESNVDIVGKSKTRLGQFTGGPVRGRENKHGIISQDEMEQVFYTQEEARLYIDVDIEPLYQLDEEENEEDVFQLDDSELIPVLATGASFDDLSEMSEAIQSHLHDLSQAHIIKTARTIRTVNETDLLKQLISQVENGEQRVTDILDRCETELKKSAGQEFKTDDAEGFDLGKYL
jgi:hypothetical protein